MFTINDTTKITIKTNREIPIKEIKHNLFLKGMCNIVKYTYFGKYVSKGVAAVDTSKGLFFLTFDVRRGVARSIVIE